MNNKILIAVLSSLSLTAASVNARETVLSTDVSTGVDYKDRQYDDSSTLPLPQGDTTLPPDQSTLPPIDTTVSGAVSGISRDVEKADLFLRPSISLKSKSTEDSATFKYAPSLIYDTVEGDSGDVNHEASAKYQRSLTREWKLKFSDVFKNTDTFTSSQMPGMEDQSGMSGSNDSGSPENQSVEDLKQEMVTAFPDDEDIMRNDAGLRRYTSNKFNVSTDYAFTRDTGATLGYAYNIMRYDDATDPTDTESYQDYDKHKVSLLLSHRFNSQYRMTAYSRYVRGLYDSDTLETNDDLNEYHAGASLSSKFEPINPITLSYDFSGTDYDETSADSSQLHKFNLGYVWFMSPTLNVSTGIGPTYTKMSDSDDSWDTNGYLKILYRNQHTSYRLTSIIGTRFDNFSGTDERNLTQYWQTLAELRQPLFAGISGSLRCGYSNENRDEVTSGMETEVDLYSAGAGLDYQFSDQYSAGLSYGYEKQDSDLSSDSYDEHKVLLTLSYKTDLFKW